MEELLDTNKQLARYATVLNKTIQEYEEAIDFLRKGSKHLENTEGTYGASDSNPNVRVASSNLLKQPGLALISAGNSNEDIPTGTRSLLGSSFSSSKELLEQFWKQKLSVEYEREKIKLKEQERRTKMARASFAAACREYILTVDEAEMDQSAKNVDAFQVEVLSNYENNLINILMEACNDYDSVGAETTDCFSRFYWIQIIQKEEERIAMEKLRLQSKLQSVPPLVHEIMSEFLFTLISKGQEIWKYSSIDSNKVKVKRLRTEALAYFDASKQRLTNRIRNILFESLYNLFPKSASNPDATVEELGAIRLYRTLHYLTHSNSYRCRGSVVSADMK